MLVKELLEKTFKMNLAELSKTLKVTYKKLSHALKEIGCEPVGSGKRGWTFKGANESVLEQSIFSFVEPSKSRSKSKNTSKNNSLENSNVVKTADNETNSRKEDTMVSEIKALIQGKKKDDSASVYKGIYYDKDIAKFLDNVQHGNKSEIVNKIMRQYLQDNELM